MRPARCGDVFEDAAGCRWVVRATGPGHVAVARPEDPEAITMSREEWEAVQAALAEAARTHNQEETR